MIHPQALIDIDSVAQLIGDPCFIEQTRQLVSQGLATLYYHDDVGTLVLRPIRRNNQTGVFIHCAIGHNKDATLNYLPFIEAVAEKSNLTFIEFHTVRKGFLRYAPRFGFAYKGQQGKFYIFRKEVSYGRQ